MISWAVVCQRGQVVDSEQRDQCSVSANSDRLVTASTVSVFGEIDAHAVVKPDAGTEVDSETNSSIDDDEAIYADIAHDSDSDSVSTTMSEPDPDEWHAVGARMASLFLEFEENEPVAKPQTCQWHAVGARMATVFLEFDDRDEFGLIER
eukprot:CAMPEP_0194511336 /NCGR_PEP_ID=MMETSP0253-20130528/42991_1 /TAXON_ID=2966 /ORGANISM="Noctiluca scintillans" /LENGTH=149 /DNA_ID=CAMNT_0039354667 /DNA_START=58 /DNA_END=507 /DNA_ORIENTATION=-